MRSESPINQTPDIPTEAKRSEAAIKLSELIYRTVVSSTGYKMSMIKDNARLIDVYTDRVVAERTRGLVEVLAHARDYIPKNAGEDVFEMIDGVLARHSPRESAEPQEQTTTSVKIGGVIAVKCPHCEAWIPPPPADASPAFDKAVESVAKMFDAQCGLTLNKSGLLTLENIVREFMLPAIATAKKEAAEKCIEIADFESSGPVARIINRMIRKEFGLTPQPPSPTPEVK